jgi:aspartate aminotransferase
MLEALDETIDAAPYEHKRNVLCDALEAIGYEVRRPEGAFYIFLKTPIPTTLRLPNACGGRRACRSRHGFGRSGYIRLSLTIPLERIEKSIGGL